MLPEDFHIVFYSIIYNQNFIDNIYEKEGVVGVGITDKGGYGVERVSDEGTNPRREPRFLLNHGRNRLIFTIYKLSIRIGAISR
jgi:hypothetical protein